MKKEEVYINVLHLTQEQLTELQELTGLPLSDIMSNPFLHYNEELNRWVSFGVWDAFTDEEIPKKEVTFLQLIEIVNPSSTINKTGEWFKGLFKWSITRPKNLTFSIDLNYWINIIILFLSYSYMVGGYNVTQWNNRMVGMFMIIVLFYDAVTNLNNNKNSDKCSN